MKFILLTGTTNEVYW